MISVDKQGAVAVAPRAARRGGGVGARRRWLAGWLGCLALVACTPEYNWRELDVADGRVRAAFPARVQTDQRDIELGGVKVPFVLASSNVQDAYFAVGIARLPAAVAGDAARRLEVGQSLTRSIYANLHAPVPAALPDFGTPIEVHSDSGEPRWALARVWLTADAAIEVIALGSPASLSNERAREFLQQARLVGKP